MNDVLLAAYLTTITKGMNAVNDLIDKFNLAQPPPPAGTAGGIPTGKPSVLSRAGSGGGGSKRRTVTPK